MVVRGKGEEENEIEENRATAMPKRFRAREGVEAEQPGAP
ncbi:uncharacterized protein An08g00320 [Aspergillus niger]|uniref:Contig An08c0020, genomic contig n=2 Tax=Aspergillus niger TaxID=5061 RepID=A2QPV4_ASPNC|nr:uncharacterized protein An08g00320 [Aspergillus niger]CAK45184.1 unnamed protein product [Aspergillus niger]